MVGFVPRKNQRFKESAPVYYRGYDSTGEGVVIDLSLNGSHIKGKMPVAEGMGLVLYVTLPGEPEPLVIEHAAVRWVKGLDFGVEFKPHRLVAERITTIIAHLVKKRQRPNA